jgi:hypothetical protein
MEQTVPSSEMVQSEKRRTGTNNTFVSPISIPLGANGKQKNKERLSDACNPFLAVITRQSFPVSKSRPPSGLSIGCTIAATPCCRAKVISSFHAKISISDIRSTSLEP